MCAAGLCSVEAARPPNNIAMTNHGGVAAVITNRLHHKVIKSTSETTTFESLYFSVTSGSNTVIILPVYHTGPITDIFFEELQTYLEVVTLYKCQIIVAGDFNIHVECSNDKDAAKLNDILLNFDCKQHVPHETRHRNGGTLDLVIPTSKSKQCLSNHRTST